MRIEASSVPLEIRLLGPLEVLRDGVAVELAGRRERSVLALLASNAGAPVGVDRLFRFLWADDAPRTADKTLQTYLSRLRRALGGELVARREAGYALVVPRDAVDAVRFRDLLVRARRMQQAGDDAGALATYRRALDEWRAEEPAAAPDTPEAIAWRQGLVAGRLDALEATMALLVRGGRHQEAAATLEELVVREPFRDELWALLMEALARGGRPAAALDAYQRARRRLADELGLDPSPRLQELQRRIIAPQTGTVAGQPATPPDGRVTPPRRRVVSPPVALTPIIGRAAELRRLTTELAGSRLVTVVGTGGVGKTRLVIEATARWPAPVAFCDLAVVQEPGAVGHALAAAAGVDPQPGGDPVEATAAALGGRTVLLVVDNCEHVVRSVRRHVHALLSRCPNLTLVATSRQALGMDGEVVVALPPLQVGDDGGDAARLFVERARRVGAVVPDDTAARALVGSICAALDGIPLAIELAAAMAGALTLDDLRDNLVDRFTLLQAPRLLAGRERNLRDTVDWSYRLLDPPAQRLLRRAAVFAGVFTADAAAQVCADGDDGAVPALLAGLAERSLLERSDGVGRTRYRMLETIREYGRDVLGEDERTALARAHARWAVRRAQELAAQRFSPDELRVVERFDRALADLRIARRWGMEAGDADVALPLVPAVHWFAFLDLRAELFGWAIEAADRFRDSRHPMLGEVLGSAITWQVLHGDVAGAAVNEAALRRLRNEGRQLGPLASAAGASLAARDGDFAAAYRDIALTYEVDARGHEAMLAEGNIIMIERYAGHVDAARRRIADLARRMEATGVPSVRAFAALGSATVLASDDPDAAIAQLRRAIALARRGRSLVTERIALSQMAAVAVLASDPAEALRVVADALGSWQRDGLWRMEWGTLRSLMELLARSGRHRDLLLLHAASQVSTTAPPLAGDQRDRLASAVAQAERALGSDGAAAARAHGRGLTDEQAVAFARTLVLGRDGGGLPDPPAAEQPVAPRS